MMGVGRIRGSALSPVIITFTATDQGGGVARLSWTTANTTQTKLYSGASLVNTGGSSGYFDVTQGYNSTATYSINATNDQGGFAAANVTITITKPPDPVFTSVSYAREGWHPVYGENWRITWAGTNVSSLTALQRIGTAAYTSSTAVKKRVPFKYTGAVQDFVVPAGVTQVEIETWGAQGGTATSPYGSTTGTGGLGGYAKKTLTVTPGETLKVYVGGAGTGSFSAADYTPTQWVNDNTYFVNNHDQTQNFYSTYTQYLGKNLYVTAGDYNYPPFGNKNAQVYQKHNGGWNGGGDAYGYFTASGGGASDVRQGGTAISNRIAVGGGGGGGSISAVWPIYEQLVSGSYTVMTDPGGVFIGYDYYIYYDSNGNPQTVLVPLYTEPTYGTVYYSYMIMQPGNPSYLNLPGGDGGGLTGNSGNSVGDQRPKTGGTGGSQTAGGKGGSRLPKKIKTSTTTTGIDGVTYTAGTLYNIPPSVRSTGTQSKGGSGVQFMDDSNNDWTKFPYAGTETYGTGVWFSDGTTQITTKGAYSDYGSGGGGGYWGGGAGNYTSDNWYSTAGDSKADPGGGQMGFAVGSGGGGSSYGDTVTGGGTRTGNGLVVISYTVPGTSISNTNGSTFYIDVPWGTLENHLLRASNGVGATVDSIFDINSGTKATLDT